MTDAACYFSQIEQDQFVEHILKGKRDGTFLDVGCNHWQTISNTCYLEKQLGWSGIGIDLVPFFEEGWIVNRPRSTFICADATTLNYDSLCDAYELPQTIDYLSLDLEPPALSLVALQRVLESSRRFRVITFETDFYRQQVTQQPSRDLLTSAGYTLKKAGRQDDFWVSAEYC